MIVLSPTLASTLDGVQGFLAPEDEALLAKRAAEVQSGQVIVEIGAYQGRSTIVLAASAPADVFVYSIDPHHDHVAGGYLFGSSDNQAFMQNVSAAQLGNKVRVLNIPSNAAVHAQRHGLRLPIGLLFVDGGHEYEQVHADVFRWLPYITRDGVVAIHDSTGTWEHPTRVADELAAFDGWTEIESGGYTRCFRSTPVNGAQS